MSLIRLIYISSAPTKPTNADLIDLLTVSRDQNARYDITGFLIYRNGTYLQVLEGEAEHVHRLFKNIQRDPRNDGVVKLLDVAIEKRDFSQWAMGFKNCNNLDLQDMPGYAEILFDGSLDESKIEAVQGRALNLLLHFSKSMA